MIFISPSQLAVFKDCRRKWAYRYIDGIKVPPKKEQQFGLEGHKRNENWLRHGKHVGSDDVGLVCQQGIKPGFMPTPASDLLIEAKLEIPILNGSAKMIGYVDCVLPPRQAGNTTTIPVAHDWKFTKDLRWAMKPGELYKDSQAAVYSFWLLKKFNAPKVVARWVYFCGRINAKSEDGRPRTPRGVKKVELTFTAEEVEANWQRELVIAQQIVETKRTYKQAKEVPANEMACDMYGGCDHRERCPLSEELGLGAMLEQWDRTHTNPDHEVEKMSVEEVMAKVKAHKAALLAQQAGAPPAGTIPQQVDTQEPRPPAGPQESTTPPAAAPPPAAAGIGLVAQLQQQSGKVETASPPAAPPHAAETVGAAPAAPDLLATLQAQSGATTINPPEATKVVVAKTEPVEQPPPTVAEPPAPTTEQPPPTVAAIAEAAGVEVLEVAIPVAEPPAEKPKTKRNTSKAAKVPFLLCIDTVPAKVTNGALGEVIHLSEFVEPFTKALAKGHRCDEHPQGVDHWNLIEFNRGVSLLAHHVASHLDNKGFRGTLVVDSHTAEARALTDVLIRRADAVFRGVR